jgi:hypothetical protein
MKFLLHCNNTEIPDLKNGTTVTPTTGPNGVLHVAGAGSAALDPAGISFQKGGGQNTDTAYLLFKGADVARAFTSEVSFNIRSNVSFSDRAPAFTQPGGWSGGFELWDGLHPVISFNMLAREWRSGESHLQFYHGVGLATTYTVPAGEEEKLFGKGVTARFRLAWDPHSYSLFINDQLVEKSEYVGGAPVPSASSFLIIGARAAMSKMGYYASADSISEFAAQ